MINSTSQQTTVLKNASILWDENDQPRSEDFDDIYFSQGDPVAETLHVFIQGNDLESRFNRQGKEAFVIGECGFGFGLNFLITCERFCQQSSSHGKLHYLSCENHPVLVRDLQRYYKNLPKQLRPFADKLIKRYPEQGKGLHRIQLQCQFRTITLDLLFNHAHEAYSSISLPSSSGVDAWFLDGHAPSHNAEMWDSQLCETIARLGKPGSTTLATYTVAGKVRRNLQAAGFNLDKSPGYGNKRHMLTGKLSSTEPGIHKQHQSWKNPWAKQRKKIQSVGVIGAGLAGCASAHALAGKGYQVTVIERNSNIAEAASGNARGIVHISPARQLNPASRFRLSAFNFAIRQYQQLAEEYDFAWNSCGLIQLAMTAEEQQDQKKLLSRQMYDPAFMLPINPEQASQIANIEINAPGLYFPTAASLAPAALCQAWMSHEDIDLLAQHTVTGFEYRDQQWHVSMQNSGATLESSFDALVICNNQDASQFQEAASYPLMSNHGQTDSFLIGEKEDNDGELKTMLRHQGYIIPWQDNVSRWVTIGGSVVQGGHTDAHEIRSTPDKGNVNSTELKSINMQMLKNFSPALHAKLNAINDKGKDIISRCGTRSTTPDYMPLAGPIENTIESEKVFAAYQRNARSVVSASGQFQPNLYLNVGHGSSGITTTPLLAEYIASLISGAVLPINQQEIGAVLPLRFLIRKLKRQQD